MGHNYAPPYGTSYVLGGGSTTYFQLARSCRGLSSGGQPENTSASFALLSIAETGTRLAA
jgi:hypothetical protein